ncbi:hypothetical protein BOTBODRAFT_37277 [Botryobasidium botryosum FD-172 SS1]|uniref:MYND-type domain-containing protein n=1 Tax=Botryobasidium botryosum (strain FD-172 SS1) TaxID=930990 RepID=A0A067MBD7_BOTB1|nr:hypothetical protein BOTBODRAFT_37277 [Botryobasidium botryosum FD-172 SS1]
MDNLGFANSLFGGLPYFNPGMMVNLSGRCATTKLAQCKNLGISTCEVSRKFDKDPDDVPDLHKEDFLARKQIVDQIAEWCDRNANAKTQIIYKNEWAPILYQYEIVQASAKRNRDWGHLIFTDMTLTQYLLVMCYGETTCSCRNPYHDDFAVMTKYHADRFMSLLKYLHHDESKPSFVRATYTTTSKRLVDPDFFSTIDVPTKTYNPPIFHVTPDNFVPSLLESELEKIDNLTAQVSHSKTPAPASVRAEVTGRKEDRPKAEQYMAANEKNAAACAYCEKIGKSTMPICSRCKLVRYCSAECQRSAWPMHKPVCKAVSKK